MTPSADLTKCANCDCWFTSASVDEVFYHATCACCRDLGTKPPSPNDHILATTCRN